MGRDSANGIATRYGLDGPGFESIPRADAVGERSVCAGQQASELLGIS